MTEQSLVCRSPEMLEVFGIRDYKDNNRPCILSKKEQQKVYISNLQAVIRILFIALAIMPLGLKFIASSPHFFFFIFSYN